MLFQRPTMVSGLPVVAVCVGIVSLLWFSASAQDNESGVSPERPAQARPSEGEGSKRTSANESRWHARNQQVKQTFAEPVQFEFDETPLGEAIEVIAEQSDFSVTFDDAALDNLGLDSDTLVTRSVANVALRTGMELILKPIDLTYVIRDGMVVITSREAADQLLTTGQYAVRDLLHADYPSQSMDDLIRVVMTSVAPDTWEDTGGPGTICAYQGILIVRQTDHAHEEIVNLIRGLRTEVLAAGGPTLPLADRRRSEEDGGMGMGGFGGGGLPASSRRGRSRGPGTSSSRPRAGGETP